MGSACPLGPLYHSLKCWVSSDVDAHFLGLFYGVEAKLCRRPAKIMIQVELEWCYYICEFHLHRCALTGVIPDSDGFRLMLTPTS